MREDSTVMVARWRALRASSSLRLWGSTPRSFAASAMICSGVFVMAVVVFSTWRNPPMVIGSSYSPTSQVHIFPTRPFFLGGGGVKRLSVGGMVSAGLMSFVSMSATGVGGGAFFTFGA